MATRCSERGSSPGCPSGSALTSSVAFSDPTRWPASGSAIGRSRSSSSAISGTERGEVLAEKIRRYRSVFARMPDLPVNVGFVVDSERRARTVHELAAAGSVWQQRGWIRDRGRGAGSRGPDGCSMVRRPNNVVDHRAGRDRVPSMRQFSGPAACPTGTVYPRLMIEEAWCCLPSDPILGIDRAEQLAEARALSAFSCQIRQSP